MENPIKPPFSYGFPMVFLMAMVFIAFDPSSGDSGSKHWLKLSKTAGPGF
jgi:hypothetical protein